MTTSESDDLDDYVAERAALEPTFLDAVERAEIVKLLAAIRADEAALQRLHPIERMIVEEWHAEPEKDRCNGCLRVAQGLYRKAFTQKMR